MTACKGCKATVSTWFGDPWCDYCGGVATRPGALLMRHVATAFFGTKTESEIRIVHDVSTEMYKFRCNRVNPRYEAMLKNGGTMTREQKRLDDFMPTPVLTKWNDTLLGLLPKLREEGRPQFSIAKTATEEERKTLEA